MKKKKIRCKVFYFCIALITTALICKIIIIARASNLKKTNKIDGKRAAFAVGSFRVMLLFIAIIQEQYPTEKDVSNKLRIKYESFKVSDDDSGELQPQNAHKGVNGSDARSFLPKNDEKVSHQVSSCFGLIRAFPLGIYS